jgi:hypothetical protein
MLTQETTQSVNEQIKEEPLNYFPCSRQVTSTRPSFHTNTGIKALK